MKESEKTQKYKIGEQVICCGWCTTSLQTIKDIDWIYHPRLEQYCWGYRFETGVGISSTGLTFNFVPEGYLRKIHTMEEVEKIVCPKCGVLLHEATYYANPKELELKMATKEIETIKEQGITHYHCNEKCGENCCGVYVWIKKD